jgi:FAD/FMN-containing dehydrogenase/Fe-S oxidoreductase
MADFIGPPRARLHPHPPPGILCLYGAPGMTERLREIPFNYTSADDRQVVTLLLGAPVWEALERLRARRVTGRSARLLLRLIGDLFILQRNPYLYQDLVDALHRRRAFFDAAGADLDIVRGGSAGDTDVALVTDAVDGALKVLERQIGRTPGRQRRILRHLGAVVGRANVRFDPFTLVAHATDATDWRLHLPVAVITPEREEQVGPLLRACARLGLPVVPRGGGTGLTGGAVPLRPGCAVLNTEKLDRVRGIRERAFETPRGTATAAVMEVEAGVLTEAAMEAAAREGRVFATDPTSAWASTIGGNIAENAGGKTAVLWGTAVDNLLSWRMAMPDGGTLTVRRVGHPLRKIDPGDTAVFEVAGEDGRPPRRVEIPASDLRKPGLGKDITNKALGGLPGLQKEGTDGIITSAEFVLHRAYPRTRTFCLEFYGPGMDEAGEVIVALSREFVDRGAEALQALEHFDEAYAVAIGYRNKAPRTETPKAVLLIDLVGHDDAETARGAERLRALVAPHRDTALFEARDAEEARRFWADRKKMGAIARRTNAFKLNEDIVLPLEALPGFARHVDTFNREEERVNQGEAAAAALALLEAGAGDPEIAAKLPRARELAAAAQAEIAQADAAALGEGRVAGGLVDALTHLVAGWPDLVAGLARLRAEWRARLVVVATHMHAGDGNVHVNIPVFSNDRWMMGRATRAADAMMAEAVKRGGVVSGEHGIGITKFKYLEPERVAALAAWRDAVDPQRLVNPGKLEDGAVLDGVFTPSFNLLELEARILQHGSLERLADKVSRCIRCGRCKPDCCVFYPARSLFYHPRNKNLAVGALVEALLYVVQRRRSTRFEPLRWLREIADHCTICHKCLKPCPVEIDTGEVSVLERELLAARRFGKKRLATRLTLGYLESRSALYNRLFRAGVLRLGGALQRTASAVARRVLPEGAGAWRALPFAYLRTPLAAASRDELFDVLPACGPLQSLVLHPAEPKATVFYFPGCGSERLFSDIGKAALWLLGKAGATVVLPPPRLCCGFPHHANAAESRAGRIELRDTVLLSQVRRMMSHLAFDACVVSCGTCLESLGLLGAPDVFGCGLQDVSAFALARGVAAAGGGDCLYHAPCHDSLGGAGLRLLKGCGRAAAGVPHCCSEAGTLALSRPDIADAMRERKLEALREAAGGRTGIPVLTNCPSCLQGLGRNAKAAGVRPRHLAVELAERAGGAGWAKELPSLFPRIEAVSF